MAEIIEMIKLNNGKTFESRKKALEFCNDQFGAEFHEILKTCPRIGLLGCIQIIETILNDPYQFLESAKLLQEINELKKLDDI